MSGITDPVQKYFKDGQWTFDGTVWRPQNQLLAYRDVVRQSWITTTATLGTNTHDFASVPTGEVWIISTITAYNNTTAASTLLMIIISSATEYVISRTAFEAITRYSSRQGQFVLKPGENIRVTFGGCVLNDTLIAFVIGHSFKINE